MAGGALAGTAAIELPVPEGEDQEVGEPDQHARDEQLARMVGVVVQQEVRERAQREDVCARYERDHPERERPPPRVLALELVWRGQEQAHQQRTLQRRQQPRWPHREPLR